VSRLSVTVSHPENLWWPEDGITKLDLVRYYDAIADHLRLVVKAALAFQH
jgi:DNA primase